MPTYRLRTISSATTTACNHSAYCDCHSYTNYVQEAEIIEDPMADYSDADFLAAAANPETAVQVVQYLLDEAIDLKERMDELARMARQDKERIQSQEQELIIRGGMITDLIAARDQARTGLAAAQLQLLAKEQEQAAFEAEVKKEQTEWLTKTQSRNIQR